MKIYWRKSSVPELAGLSKSERNRIWAATELKPLRHWQFWATSVVYIAFLYSALRWIQDIPMSLWIRALIFGLVTAIGSLLVGGIMIELKRPYMRALLEKSATTPGAEQESGR